MKTSLFTSITPKKILLNKINKRHQINASNVKIDRKLGEDVRKILEENKSSIGRMANKNDVVLEFQPANDLWGNTQMLINKLKIVFPEGFDPTKLDCGHKTIKETIAKHILDSNKNSFVNDIKMKIKSSVPKENNNTSKPSLLKTLNKIICNQTFPE